MESPIITEGLKPAETGPPIENGMSNHLNGLDKSGSSSSHKHSSSSSNKHGSSSSSHKHGSSSSSHRHSSSHKSHSSGSHKDKHSSSSKSGSSSSTHKHSSHHSSSSHKHREGGSSGSHHKHHSSSGSRDPSKHSSSKHSSSSSSKDKQHSSSHKHRDGSSSGSKHQNSDHKHRDGDKNRHSSSHHSSEKNKENHEKSSAEKKEQMKSPERIKQEVGSPPRIKEELSPTVKMEPLSPTKLHVKDIKEDSDDDIPLSTRYDKMKSEASPVKRVIEEEEEDDDDVPLSSRAEKIKKQKVKVETSTNKDSKKRKASLEEDFVPNKKKKSAKTPVKKEPVSPTKKGKKKEEETKWKWWEEDKKQEGVKWNTLEHKGPQFAPPYEPLPSHVKFYYNKKTMKLSEGAEEVATFYARMLDHDYTTKDMFNTNFFKDWKKTMTREEKEHITDLKLCDFREIGEWFKLKTEERKNMSKEEKNKIKEQNAALVEEFGFCIIDGHKQKIGNFKIEPPGLFRGRGDHPKQGMLKRRTMPEDVILNCSKEAKVPDPPAGRKWKEVRHDNTVTWLACWSENVQGSTKYVMLNAASKLKGEKDWQKYETARNLHKHVDKIRAQYREDWKSKEMRLRQRAVAMYFIDKLALRAGNEKDEDQADTVGCCSLRVEHLKLYEQLQDKEFVVEFDFLGKDSIRYFNQVPVEKRVFKNLQLFMENKQTGDDLFDRLNTAILNKHLQSLMNGLTAKVFRTFNASKTLQDQLDLLTNDDDPLPAKILAYNRANRAVAILCNHQRAVPKNFDKQMENLQAKLDKKRDEVRNAKKELKQAKSDHKAMKCERTRKLVEKRKKAIERFQNQLTNIEVQATDKDENKEIALGTSKLNYLDPRISIAWCKKWDVPVEKVYNKTQREKFAWAIDMADDDFRF